MKTVGPSAADDELHLLHEWGDPASSGRTRIAGIVSVIVHIALLVTLALAPPDVLAPRAPELPEMRRVVTPLIDPITEFTQPTANKKKPAKELDIAALQPRPRIQVPQGAPSTSRPMAARPVEIPTARQPVAAPLPEPPKIEAVVKETPKLELPPSNSTVAPPPVQTVQKPKLTMENVGGAPPLVRPEQSKVAIPSTSVADAIRQNTRTPIPGGGLTVGDPGAGAGGYGEGINLPPSPGVQGSALELKSDPMGVDFRPYLTQILATIRRNWYAVMPESVKLGRRGKVGLLFKIVRSGKVEKVVYAFQSGADSLDRAAIAAISASNPFPPLPAEFKGDNVVLQLNFAYNAPKQ